jgi:serine/threonine protein kinase
VEQTIGNYTLLRLLGRGGMGSVYEARHSAIERRVAIKILHKEFCEDPEVLKRFVNEARAVNIIGHPGLVGVSEFGQTPEGAPFIVMEYIEGITLREWLTRNGGKLSVEQTMLIARQMASTLAAAHAKQIVHRDLKPVNIMLCTEEGSGTLERVKILDFGIAKLGTENVSQTKSGVLMGTPAYMSPEQCRSARSAVDRSDVYALGIMMYEMLVGETPFRGGPALLMAGHMTMDPPSLAARAPSTPPELSALIHRMLAKNPSERPSAEEVARNLSSASGSISVVAAPGSAPLRVDAGTEPLTVLSQSSQASASLLAAVPISQRRMLVLAAAVAAVLLIGIVGVTVVLLIGGKDQRTPARGMTDLRIPIDADAEQSALADAAVTDSSVQSGTTPLLGAGAAVKPGSARTGAAAHAPSPSKGKKPSGKGKGAAVKKKVPLRSTK